MIAGIVLAFFGNVGMNVGTNVIALHHELQEQGTDAGKEWVGSVGLALFASGAAVSFASWAFGEQIVIAAFGSVQFISNVVCARAFFGVPVTSTVLVSTLMIIGGNTLIILPPFLKSSQVGPGEDGNRSSSTDPNLPGSEDLFALYGKTGFQVYAIFAAAVAMYTQAQYNAVVVKEEQTLQAITPREKREQMYRYVCISGFVGATATTLSKSCSSMLVLTATHWHTKNQFLSSFFYILVLVWIYSMMTWASRMDNALRLFDSFAVVVLQLVWTLYSIVQGGIYYQEFDSYGGVEYGFLAGGLLLVCAGVYCLAPEPPQALDEEEAILFSSNGASRAAALTYTSSTDLYVEGKAQPESDECHLQEAVRQVNERITQSRRATGYGFSMPMDITSHWSRSKAENIPVQRAKSTGQPPLEVDPHLSLAQMDRRVRMSIAVKRTSRGLTS